MFSIITHLKSKVLSSWSIFATLGGMQLHAGKARFPGIVGDDWSFQFDAKSWHQLLQLANSCTVGRVFMLAPHATVCFQRRSFWFAAWRKLGKIWYNIVQHDESYTYTIPISRKWRCNVMMLFWRTSRQFPLILRFSLACSVSPLVRHQHT